MKELVAAFLTAILLLACSQDESRETKVASSDGADKKVEARNIQSVDKKPSVPAGTQASNASKSHPTNNFQIVVGPNLELDLKAHNGKLRPIIQTPKPYLHGKVQDLTRSAGNRSELTGWSLNSRTDEAPLGIAVFDGRTLKPIAGQYSRAVPKWLAPRNELGPARKKMAGFKIVFPENLKNLKERRIYVLAVFSDSAYLLPHAHAFPKRGQVPVGG